MYIFKYVHIIYINYGHVKILMKSSIFNENTTSPKLAKERKEIQVD